MNREQLIGKKFNKLTVESMYLNAPKVNLVKYKCVCDCGKSRIVLHNNLVYNKTKSCGCLRNQITADYNKKWFRKTPGYSSSLNLFKCYKKRARKIKVEFALLFEDFLKLTKLNCYYCESPPYNKHKISSKDKEWEKLNTYIYNGLDRIDSDLGYVINNVVPCCKICNTAKMDHPQDQFIEWLNRIANKFGNKL